MQGSQPVFQSFQTIIRGACPYGRSRSKAKGKGENQKPKSQEQEREEREQEWVFRMGGVLVGV